MTHRTKILAAAAALPLIALALTAALRNGAESLQPCVEAHRAASTYPDYAGAVIPPNIAPLNLKVLEPGRKFCLRISAAGSQPIEIFSGDGNIRIPLRAWRNLLAAQKGGALNIDIYAKSGSGWTHFDATRYRVAAEEIDRYVVYRYIPPIYNKWDEISLRQRDLTSFDERVLFDTVKSADRNGKTADGACINCHTFLNHDGDEMLLHMRPGRKSQIPAMIVARGGKAEKIDTRNGAVPPAAYISWHPGGKLLAFSRNGIVEMFHTAGVETRVVVDKDSDLGIYNLDTGLASTVPQIARPDRLETLPAWAPDGRYLYFCSAPLRGDRNRMLQQYDQIRYDIERIAYDDASGRWGQVETVVAAGQLGKSVSFPVVSPDGRYLMFCAHDYGNFPIFQPSSDLYLVDLSRIAAPPAFSPPAARDAPPGAHPLAVGKAAPRRLDEIDSPRADSYHSWSGNSRWAIFASKREDGMFARLYIAHMDAEGRFGKPFVMPQESPDFYGRCLMTFNRPELVRNAVTVSAAEIARAMNSTAIRAKGAAPQNAAPAQPDQPWQH